MPHVHTIDAKRHQAFLAEQRVDPILREKLNAGDRIVFCARCKCAFLESAWNYIGGRHCEQSETLREFPAELMLILPISVKVATPSKPDFICPITGMEFVFVNGGTFQMGDTFGNGWYIETPVHEVSVDSFYIGRFQVTQVEWQKIMGNNPSHFKGDRNPVEMVSWDETQAFIKKLQNETGKHYRLPTEAEWEYAARSGGKKEKYAGGNNMEDVAWSGANFESKTHPVGQKQPNGLGLYDMSGNVSEWCSDWFVQEYYSNSPPRNPNGPTSGERKMVRGGPYGANLNDGRASDRQSIPPDDSGRFRFIGLRLALPQA